MTNRMAWVGMLCLIALAGTGILAEEAPAQLKENDGLRQLVKEEKEEEEEEEEDKPKPDKSRYNLFCPTPKEYMREMSTDRPDTTESAISLDAGHFQLETTLMGFTYDERNSERSNSRTKTYEFWNANYKVGLLDNVDLQVVVPSYTVERTTESGRTKIIQGFGDVTVRTKVNIRGNEGGASVALMPFIKLPTNQGGLGNKYVEGGVVAPWCVDLPKGWSTAGQLQLDLLRNESGRDYHVDYGGTYNFGREIIKKVSGYWEFAGKASSEKGTGWVGSFNTGVIYELNDNVRFDASINVGVTRSSDDFKTFIGMSYRY